MAEIELGNLYEFNKNAMSQFEPMDIINFNRMVNSIANMMLDAVGRDQHYWMLLCHDRRDFTLFNIIACEEFSTLVNEIKPTLLNRGAVLDIGWQTIMSAYEIWIREPETNENFAYYLFPYDEGVIEVNN